jgi:hypothetical protein
LKPIQGERENDIQKIVHGKVVERSQQFADCVVFRDGFQYGHIRAEINGNALDFQQDEGRGQENERQK